MAQSIRPDLEALSWEGAIEVVHTPDGSRPWRLPYSRIGLFPTDALRMRAAMCAGVRIVLDTDSTTVAGRAAAPVDPDLTSIDLVVDGGSAFSIRVGSDGWFQFSGLPEPRKTVELWLPQYGDFQLTELVVDEGSQVWRTARPYRPRLLVYGSSITHCRDATSPTRTWPALVAAELGADLTCLGFAGQCHLDPMVARVLRDRPADLIIACLGVNVYGNGSFNSRSFLPAVLGFLSTLRDGHPGVPIVAVSPIVSPSREDTVGGADLTLAAIRAEVHRAVHILRDYGDTALHVVDGRTVLGSDRAHLLHDGIHPDAEGYQYMARALSTALGTLTRTDRELDQD
ncbi:GDSL-type esterase/lipase family protein [Kribbella sp. NPDC050124]|uniref:GDSL-type esterase/lipase family protein n=1 Tax=Kribbella sp. NPDC050124 TaxID=3364114 RepID=UPI0037B99BB8